MLDGIQVRLADFDRRCFSAIQQRPDLIDREFFKFQMLLGSEPCSADHLPRLRKVCGFDAQKLETATNAVGVRILVSKASLSLPVRDNLRNFEVSRTRFGPVRQRLLLTECRARVRRASY